MRCDNQLICKTRDRAFALDLKHPFEEIPSNIYETLSPSRNPPKALVLPSSSECCNDSSRV